MLDITGKTHEPFILFLGHSPKTTDLESGLNLMTLLLVQCQRIQYLRNPREDVSLIITHIVLTHQDMTRSAYCLFYVSELHVGQAVSIPVEQEENLIPELLRQSIMMNDSNRSDYSNRLFGGLLEQTLLAMQTD